MIQGVIFLHSVVSLWPHESFDKREEHRATMLQSNEEWIEKSKLLLWFPVLYVV